MKEVYILADSVNKSFYFLFSLMDYDDLPIVFVVRDQEDNIYLCDCTEFRDYQKWIIARTNIQTLLDIVNQKLSVYDALVGEHNGNIIAEYDYNKDAFTATYKKFDDINEDELPVKDAMLRYVANDVKEKIIMLNIMLNMNEYSKILQNDELRVTKSEKYDISDNSEQNSIGTTEPMNAPETDYICFAAA